MRLEYALLQQESGKMRILLYANDRILLSWTRRIPQGSSTWYIATDRNAKESSNYFTIALISHTSKVMLKILQARLQQYMHWELPDVQAGFRKGRRTRDQIADICWIIKKKQENSRKISTSASLTMAKPLTVWITKNCGKFLKRWDYQLTTLPVS